MLLRLGIASRLYRNRRDAGTGMLPDGRAAAGNTPPSRSTNWSSAATIWRAMQR